MAWQLRYRIRRLLPLGRPKPAEPGRARLSDQWSPDPSAMGLGILRHDPISILVGVFDFLNHRLTVGFPPHWDVSEPSRLWLYNLHYFEYIWSLEYEESRRVAADWMEQYPFRRDRVGWEPYPLSLRLQNWCGYFLGRHLDRTRSDDIFFDRLLASIARQARFLERNLEFHLLGNHLLENAASLTLSGTCLSGPDAERQRRVGLALLNKQLKEQLLSDGFQFERSPMYQARLTYLLSQLVATRDQEIVLLTDEPHQRMRAALAAVSHPDQKIALFNDAAFGIAPGPEDMGIRELPYGAFSLSDAGYFGWRGRSGNFLICDAGSIGPDYLPGHAHGDIFSFELSLNGSRVIVDSGVFDYEPTPMRSYCRSTRAHNTVEIEGADQCEFWDVFRVGRRGRPHGVTFDELSDGFVLFGEHDGYRRLAGSPVHRRLFRWSANGVLVIKDRVSSSKAVKYVSRLHLHPECEVVELDIDRTRIRHPSGTCLIAWKGDGRLDTEESWYCPEFGIRRKTRALAFTSTSPGQTTIRIAPDEAGLTFDL